MVDYLHLAPMMKLFDSGMPKLGGILQASQDRLIFSALHGRQMAKYSPQALMIKQFDSGMRRSGDFSQLSRGIHNVF
jgi:hypothetical protein